MVIDDTPQYLELMAAVLTSHGYTVITHSQAQGAVEAVKLAAPDLLIVDAQLGEASGFDIIAQLKEDEANLGLRILVCTATGIEGGNNSAALLERHGLDLLSKPFELTAFLAKVGEMLAAPAGGSNAGV